MDKERAAYNLKEGTLGDVISIALGLVKGKDKIVRLFVYLFICYRFDRVLIAARVRARKRERETNERTNEISIVYKIKYVHRKIGR